MADVKTVSISSEAARQIVERTEKPSEDKKKQAEMLRRVCDFEYSLNQAHDALLVITRAVGDVAERHASPDNRELDEEDISTLYGIISLLESVADGCKRAYMGEA